MLLDVTFVDTLYESQLHNEETQTRAIMSVWNYFCNYFFYICTNKGWKILSDRGVSHRRRRKILTGVVWAEQQQCDLNSSFHVLDVVQSLLIRKRNYAQCNMLLDIKMMLSILSWQKSFKDNDSAISLIRKTRLIKFWSSN